MRYLCPARTGRYALRDRITPGPPGAPARARSQKNLHTMVSACQSPPKRTLPIELLAARASMCRRPVPPGMLLWDPTYCTNSTGFCFAGAFSSFTTSSCAESPEGSMRPERVEFPVPGGGGWIALPVSTTLLAAVLPRPVGGREERPVPGGTEEAGRVEGQSSIAASTWPSRLERVCIFSRRALSCSSRDGPLSCRRFASVSWDDISPTSEARAERASGGCQ
jgi:hypothetical protein